MASYTVAINFNTSLVEVHKQGCAHTNQPHMEVIKQTTAGDPAVVAERESQQDQGVGFILGACVRKEVPVADRKRIWAMDI